MKTEKKVIIPIDMTLKDKRACYKASLLSNVSFKKLGYQCSREELKLFKEIVIRSFVRDAIEEFINDK